MLDKIDLEIVVAIAKEAGDTIIEIYDREFTIDNLVIGNNIVADAKRFMSKTLPGKEIVYVNNLDNSKIRFKIK